MQRSWDVRSLCHLQKTHEEHPFLSSRTGHLNTFLFAERAHICFLQCKHTCAAGWANPPPLSDTLLGPVWWNSVWIHASWLLPREIHEFRADAHALLSVCAPLPTLSPWLYSLLFPPSPYGKEAGTSFTTDTSGISGSHFATVCQHKWGDCGGETAKGCDEMSVFAWVCEMRSEEDKREAAILTV